MLSASSPNIRSLVSGSLYALSLSTLIVLCGNTQVSGVIPGQSFSDLGTVVASYYAVSPPFCVVTEYVVITDKAMYWEVGMQSVLKE